MADEIPPAFSAAFEERRAITLRIPAALLERLKHEWWTDNVKGQQSFNAWMIERLQKHDKPQTLEGDTGE